MSRIGLIGAGYISRVHADVLAGLSGHHVSAVIDPNLDAAERLARSIGAPHALVSVEAALAAGVFDRAHVLVPPDLHAAVGGQILAAGIPVLLEKPLAATGAECAVLLAAAQASGASLGVNQNFVHHPAFLRLQTAIAGGRLGAVTAITCLYNVPLRQLAARQFGHWMFRRPGNLLLEQAVHPLSQILTLAGAASGVRMQPGRAIEIAPGLPFVGDFCAILDTPIPAQLRFAVGQSFPFWQMIVIGTDGVGVADILANRVSIHGRTRWMEPVDVALSGLATAGGLAWSSLSNFAGYAAGMAKLGPPGDPFLRSMKGSIAAFHGALDAGQKPVLDGAFGAALVDLCETMADDLPVVRPRPTRVAPTEPAEVAILGGTGFIGTHAVRRFVAAGKHIVVMARSLRNLPDVFDSPFVRVESGDIGDAAAVARVIAGCQCVVNLAHGGGGGSFEAVRHAMVGGAETVARACREAGIRRLVHVGSIASLYLGPQTAVISGRTPADPREIERGDYARAKVLADRMLLDMHNEAGLPVVILRPGVVVGEGSSPFHSGLGLYNNEQHCIGWNDGRNPLPFVLVADVADAIFLACAAPGIDGKCYNLVGDVRPNARDYTAMLAAALHRPLRYHPQSPTQLWLTDAAKWVIKRAIGRDVPMPSKRDFLSRGMQARFDCTDAQRDLDWRPNADSERFRQRAIQIHAPADG